MKSLLDHDAPGLYDRLQSASMATCRRALVEGLKAAASTLESVPPIAMRTLEDLADELRPSPEAVEELRTLEAKADERYLELQEHGEDALAIARFSEARFLTALSSCAESDSRDAFAEVAYELLHAAGALSVSVRAIEESLGESTDELDC